MNSIIAIDFEMQSPVPRESLRVRGGRWESCWRPTDSGRVHNLYTNTPVGEVAAAHLGEEKKQNNVAADATAADQRPAARAESTKQHH